MELYECNIEDTVPNSLATRQFDTDDVPGGCTKYVQAPDVSCNKTSKANWTEKYNNWLAKKGINNETEIGNLKAPLRKTITEQILDAWVALSSKMIKESFIHCALSLPTDGSRDDLIIAS